MVSDKKIFWRFQIFLSFIALGTRGFQGITFFEEILNKTMAGTFVWTFIKIGQVVSEKTFKIKVYTWTDGRTTDTVPCHKPAGLWPVKLITYLPPIHLVRLDNINKICLIYIKFWAFNLDLYFCSYWCSWQWARTNWGKK